MLLKRNLIAILTLVMAFGLVAVAQHPQEQTQTPDGNRGQDRMERTERHRERSRERMERHKGMHGRGGIGRLMKDLDLTEVQREQIRTITQRQSESLKPQREELSRLREKRVAGTFNAEDEARLKVLRQEMRASIEGVRAETEGILSVEQKSKLEQLKREQKAKHEERKVRREQRMKERQQQLNNNNF